jgi:hypothetical protein
MRRKSQGGFVLSRIFYCFIKISQQLVQGKKQAHLTAQEHKDHCNYASVPWGVFKPQRRQARQGHRQGKMLCFAGTPAKQRAPSPTNTRPSGAVFSFAVNPAKEKLLLSRALKIFQLRRCPAPI